MSSTSTDVSASAAPDHSKPEFVKEIDLDELNKMTPEEKEA